MINLTDQLYNFVYRGVLTEASLDKIGRQRRRHFSAEDHSRSQKALAYDLLDNDLLVDAQQMAVIYTAIHAFENMIRQFVQKAMAEEHKEVWWNKVPERIQKRVKTRMEEDAKFRYHGARGASELMYCDFGDLSSIIVTNWPVFEDILVDMGWAKAVLDMLEKSRNIVMHGGVLGKEDVERIGMNIRDWIRQSG